MNLKEAVYDVALSFAGEDRQYVDAVAKALKENRIRVFYDRFEEVNLWGKNLYVYLREVYRDQARFTVMFISGGNWSRTSYLIFIIFISCLFIDNYIV